MTERLSHKRDCLYKDKITCSKTHLFSTLASEGSLPYEPKGFLKRYVYGNDNGIKYSRKLAKSYKVNVEIRWMLVGAVEWGFTLIDGSKFATCNSKNNNFAKNKLDDRIKRLDGHIEEYLSILDDVDRQEDYWADPEWLAREFIWREARRSTGTL